ncbi:hypothetical protein G7Z17_g2151 [Cylindrodendrum hubeiense]|uniref:Uncharacterized protein n=1 Tax=Cylindrodendrum hubeiense TaxID=595255 RepID=A0A9P5LER1_9HYPO|nr:hypothetical protein G7Z17_g2151 [Cylindrodendrum hubeiense]
MAPFASATLPTSSPNAQGVKKANWFQNLVVDKVTKNQSGEGTFTFKSSYYSFEITSKEFYGKLNVTMSKSGARKVMDFKRIWQSKGEQSNGTGRIWTGKVNWLNFASNELAIFIVPEGFGEGKPVLSLWQWTKDSPEKTKAPSFREAVQKMEAGAGDGIIKFSYHSYYNITCSWSEKTEKLAVQMNENGTKGELGEMTLSALIEHHSHDFNPPESALDKSSLEVRLPQAQSSLPRILTPLPFPKGLIETLAQTAAFVDQAGYLAKHAQELTMAREDWEKEKKALFKKITDLEDLITKDAKHDAEDHKILQSTRKELVDEHARLVNLQKLLDTELLKSAKLDAKLKVAVATITDLQTKLSGFQSRYNVEKKHNDKLRADNAQLTARKLELEISLQNLQTALTLAEQTIERRETAFKKQHEDLHKLTIEKKDLATRFEALEAERDTADSEVERLGKALRDALRHA